MDDNQFKPILNKLRSALSRFNIKIERHTPNPINTCRWMVYEDDDSGGNDWPFIHWPYRSIHEMLFGSSSMKSLFDNTCFDECQLEHPAIKFLGLLKSDSIEELSIKLDLYTLTKI